MQHHVENPESHEPPLKGDTQEELAKARNALTNPQEHKAPAGPSTVPEGALPGLTIQQESAPLKPLVESFMDPTTDRATAQKDIDGINNSLQDFIK